ncbi:MAG: AraC family transcriptional regulator [Acetobacteraceae bacterium]
MGPKVSGGQQRVGALAEVPQLLRELGADPAEVAAGVGLDVSVLHDPENSIPFTAAGRLLQAGAMRTGCAHFGLLVGQRCDTRSLGLVGRLMRNARTWGRAVQDLVDNQHRYVRGGVPYLVVHGGVAWAGYAIHQQGTESIDHFCDGAIAIGFNMMRELCGSLPSEVLLSRRPPADIQPYRRFFRVPVRFDAEQSALIFPDGLLERPVPGADSRQREILEASVAKYWALALPNATEQVVRILRSRVLFGDSTLDEVARCLKIHPRTLNRRLQSEGTTFRTLLNEAHFEVAQQLLAGTRISVSGIAIALGYAETSAFSHAFHRMAGVPPSEWRAGSGPQRLAVEAYICRG